MCAASRVDDHPLKIEAHLLATSQETIQSIAHGLGLLEALNGDEASSRMWMTRQGGDARCDDQVTASVSALLRASLPQPSCTC